MTVMSLTKLFSLCFIAHCSWLCTVSSRNTEKQVDSLLPALKDGRGDNGGGGGFGGGGSGRPCKAGSDCTAKEEGCFTITTPKGTSSICLICDEDKNGVKQLGAKYDVDGCGGQAKTWIIVGIVAGAILIAAVIITLVVCCLLPSCPLAKRRNNRNEQYGQYPQAGGQGQYQGQPRQYEFHQGQNQGQPGQFQGQQGQYLGQQGQYGAQPGLYQGQQGQNTYGPGQGPSQTAGTISTE